MAQRIPRHFHFVFGLRPQKEAFHVLHYLCLESCLQVNRPERITLYYHYMPYGPYWERIRPKLELVYVELKPAVTQYQYADQKLNEFRYAHQADFIRLEQILQHGGVYADIDTLFLNPIGEHLYEKPFVIGREPIHWEPVDGRPRTSLCNAFLMSEPNSSFGRRWLEAMGEAFDGTWSNHSTFLPQRLAEAHPAELHIEAEESYYGFEPTPEALFRLFEDPNPVPSDELAKMQSIHLWEHLWWERKRIDFSPVHKGMLTEPALRTGQANYHRLARRFLPEEPIVAVDEEPGLWEQAQERFEAGLRYGRALGGVLLLPALQRFFPGKGRLDLARAYLAHAKAQRQFVDLTPFDQGLMRWVIQWDEYGVFRSPFKPEDVVIDVGAHIGCFSFACWESGSRSIHSFEANPFIFPRLERHLGGRPGIQLNERAVFRSDRQVEQVLHSGPRQGNTGRGSVLFGAQAFEFHRQRLDRSIEASPMAARTIGLDEILERFERVKLLKVDCEGSEFPILLTSKQLGKVERIVGEYHELTRQSMSLLSEEARIEGFETFALPALAEVLRSHGFQFKSQASTANIGHFEAWR